MRLRIALLGVGVLAVVLVGAGTVQRALKLWAHERVCVYRFGPQDPTRYSGGFGIARRSDLTSPHWGPVLLRDPLVVEHRIRDLVQIRDHGGGYESLIRYRGEWALAYAGLRLQGKSPDQILTGPNGAELFAGTLAAESLPPKWWAQAEWLQQRLDCRPSGTLHLGLIRPAAREAGIRAVLASPSRHVQAALVFSLERQDQGFDQAHQLTVLMNWARSHLDFFSPNYAQSLATMLQVRQSFIAALGESGPVCPQVTFADSVPTALHSQYRELLGNFLRSCGYRPDPQGRPVALQVSVAAIHFEDVGSHTVEFTDREVKEYHHVPGTGRFPGHTTVVSRVVKDGQAVPWVGPERVVTVCVSLGGSSPFCSPPYADISRDDLRESLEAFDASARTPVQEKRLESWLSYWAIMSWSWGVGTLETNWEPSP